MTYSVLAFHSSQTNVFRSQLSDQVVPECLAYEQKTKSPSHPVSIAYLIVHIEKLSEVIC